MVCSASIWTGVSHQHVTIVLEYSMTGNIVSTSVAQALNGLHQAPRTEKISRTHSWVLTRSRYSKETNDDRYSIHFYSTVHATSGVTVDDVARQARLSPYA